MKINYSNVMGGTGKASIVLEAIKNNVKDGKKIMVVDCDPQADFDTNEVNKA